MANRKNDSELTLEKYDPNEEAEVDESKELDVLDNQEPEPVHIENAPLELYGYVPTSDDIRIPRIRLAQALSPDVVDGDAKAGQWLIPNVGNKKDVTFTILGMKRSREYRVVDDHTDDMGEVSCESDDGIIGYGDPGGECKVCPMSQWTGDSSSRRPPACTLRYHYLVVVDGHDQVCEVIMQKTQITTAQQINALYRQAGPGRTKITLASELNRGKGRSWYTPKVVKFSRLKETQVPGSDVE